MLLYVKFVGLLCVAVAAQCLINGVGRQSLRDTWFAVRCQIADVSGDDTLTARLVEEGRRELVAHLDANAAVAP